MLQWLPAVEVLRVRSLAIASNVSTAVAPFAYKLHQIILYRRPLTFHSMADASMSGSTLLLL